MSIDVIDRLDWSKYKNIIIVGCDGVGKTTLSNQIAEKFGFEYKKASVSDAKDKIKCAIDHLSSIDENSKVIYDRFYFPDDLIYTKIINLHVVEYDIHDWSDVIQKLNDSKFTLVYLSDDINKISQRFSDRGDEFVDVSQLQSIVDLYEAFLLQIEGKIEVVRIDIDKQ